MNMTTRSASIPNASWASPNGIQRHWHSVLVEGEGISDYRIQLDVLCRVCPGKELALNSLFIVMATVIATLDISKAKDDHGHEIEPQCDYTPSMVRYVSQNMLPVIAISLSSYIVTRYPSKLALHRVRRKRRPSSELH